MRAQEVLCAYVLHKRPYRETSMLVDFFSLEQGLIRSVVKGVRCSTKSDRKSLLQSFQKVEFTLAGKGQLKNLGRLESLHVRHDLRAKPLYCGMYINEILSRCLPEAEPLPEIFSDYEQSIAQLASINRDDLSSIEPILRIFELNMLQILGYLPDFNVEAVSGELIDPQQYYRFDAQSGFHLSHAQAKSPIKGQYILDIVEGKLANMNNLSSADVESDTRQNLRKVAKQICRLAMQPLLGQKPLKSRELFLLD